MQDSGLNSREKDEPKDFASWRESWILGTIKNKVSNPLFGMRVADFVYILTLGTYLEFYDSDA